MNTYRVPFYLFTHFTDSLESYAERNPVRKSIVILKRKALTFQCASTVKFNIQQDTGMLVGVTFVGILESVRRFFTSLCYVQDFQRRSESRKGENRTTLMTLLAPQDMQGFYKTQLKEIFSPIV